MSDLEAEHARVSAAEQGHHTAGVICPYGTEHVERHTCGCGEEHPALGIGACPTPEDCEARAAAGKVTPNIDPRFLDFGIVSIDTGGSTAITGRHQH